MTVSVFLGGFGFGNLGDEACLATSYDLYKGDINTCFTVDPVVTAKAAHFDMFFTDPKELFKVYPEIDKVILAGGGLGFMPSFRDNLDWAMRCKDRGAKVYVHNIGVTKIGNAWGVEFPYLVPILQEAAAFSVRDYRSKEEVESWGFDLHPEVSYYPERGHPKDPKLASHIPTGQDYIGISINDRDELWSVIPQNMEQIRTLLSKYDGTKILPIVSTIHKDDPQEHDNEGFWRFIKQFGLEDRVVFPELANWEFWHANVGPGDVKYAVSRCKHLISARKHNIIHAIGSGVPFTALFEFDNDSIPRVYQTLYSDLPPGSSLFPLFPM